MPHLALGLHRLSLVIILTFSSDDTCVSSTSTQTSNISADQASAPATGLEFVLDHLWVIGPLIEGCSQLGFTSDQVQWRGDAAMRLRACGSLCSEVFVPQFVFYVENPAIYYTVNHPSIIRKLV